MQTGAKRTIRLRIRAHLEAQGMTISEMARRSGLSWPTSQYLAADKPIDWKLSTLAAAADALGVRIGDLLEDG